MKFSSFIAVIATAVAVVHASSPHAGLAPARRSRFGDLAEAGVKRNTVGPVQRVGRG